MKGVQTRKANAGRLALPTLGDILEIQIQEPMAALERNLIQCLPGSRILAKAMFSHHPDVIKMWTFSACLTVNLEEPGNLDEAESTGSSRTGLWKFFRPVNASEQQRIEDVTLRNCLAKKAGPIWWRQADQPALLLFFTSGGKSLKFDVESLEFPDQPVGSWPIDSSASPLTVTFQHLATPHNSQHTWNTGSCKTQQFQCNTEEFWTAPKPDDCPAPSRVKRYIVNIVISQTEKISYEDGQHQKHLRDLQESLSVLESKLEHNQIEPLVCDSGVY